MGNRWLRRTVPGLIVATIMFGVPRPVRGEDAVNNFFIGTQLYIWNRFSDFLDIVNLGIAIGPSVGAEVGFTETASLGAYYAREKGTVFPVLPPLWIVPAMEDKPIFETHEGRYWTRVFGRRRAESSVRRDFLFPREQYDIRAQVGLGLAQVYLEADLAQAADFLVGLAGVDLLNDDVQRNPRVTNREPGRASSGAG